MLLIMALKTLCRTKLMLQWEKEDAELQGKIKLHESYAKDKQIRLKVRRKTQKCFGVKHGNKKLSFSLFQVRS